jgi:hypothetical protein
MLLPMFKLNEKISLKWEKNFFHYLQEKDKYKKVGISRWISACFVWNFHFEILSERIVGDVGRK